MKNLMDSQMRIYQEGRKALMDMDTEKKNLVQQYEEAKESTAGLKVKSRKNIEGNETSAWFAATYMMHSIRVHRLLVDQSARGSLK